MLPLPPLKTIEFTIQFYADAAVQITVIAAVIEAYYSIGIRVLGILTIKIIKHNCRRVLMYYTAWALVVFPISKHFFFGLGRYNAHLLKIRDNVNNNIHIHNIPTNLRFMMKQ